MFLTPGKSFALLITVGLLFLLAVLPAKAQVPDPTLPVTAPGPISVLEGTENFELTFTVTNKSTHDRIVDYVLATVGPPNPDDAGDRAYFAGNNGSDGLVSADVVIPAGKSGAFTYKFATDALDPGAFGINPVTFQIEMSDLAANNGQTLTLTSNNIGMLEYVNNTVALNTDKVLGDPTPAITSIKVNDVPEPSSALTAAFGLVCLAGISLRARRRAYSS